MRLKKVHNPVAVDVQVVRHLSRKEMEARRFAASDMLDKGVKNSYVADTFSVSRTTVGRWRSAMALGRSLALSKPTGRPCMVSNSALAELYESQASWNKVEFLEAVLSEFGVKYSLDHVGRLVAKFRRG